MKDGSLTIFLCQKNDIDELQMKIKFTGAKVKKLKQKKTCQLCKLFWRPRTHLYAQTVKCSLMIVWLTVHLPENLLAAIWIKFK